MCHVIISGCSDNNLSSGIITCRERSIGKLEQLYIIPCCVQSTLMSAGQNPTILSWVEEVARSVAKTPTHTDRFEELVGSRTSTPSTPASQHKRKRSVPEAQNLMSQSDPSKRTCQSAFGTLEDIVSLASSGPASSQSEQARSLSPSNVKAELAAASLRVVYIYESADPRSLAASQLLATLTQDSVTVMTMWLGKSRMLRANVPLNCVVKVHG